MSGDKDIFIINKIFPNAKDIFAVSGRPTTEIKNDCLFIFDTNSLILPYTTSSESLDEIKKVYTKIIKEKRFFIPGQVAREFAKIRPEKIKEVFQQLTKSRNSIPVLGIGKYPLLDGIKDYDELSEKEKEINSLVKDYAKQLGKLIEHVKEWSWNDPVSQLYKSLFTDEVIYDIELDEEKIKEQLEYRYENKIPPGYEDKNKGDGGIGDLLIWFTILELAEKYKKDIVFISGDEKKDWFYQVDKQSLYPKFELIAEFRGKAPGRSFHILKLSELLEMFGVDKKVVKEFEFEEQETLISDSFLPNKSDIQSKVEDWVKNNYKFKYFVKSDNGFPDMVIMNEIGQGKIGIEIIEFRSLGSLSSKLTRILKKIIESTTIYERFVFIIVYDNSLMMDVVLTSLNLLKSMLLTSDVNFEIIPGHIRKDKFEKILQS
ncbi:PIN domain-containing protein [Chryseobacterium soli]|uniref:PIN domain-containing protein n=1 Tax=Chryseobacterium soli TaxID=445961 RepID=UPI00068A4358|nr:PIN domain-containing protein [Chryseobacterium soli]